MGLNATVYLEQFVFNVVCPGDGLLAEQLHLSCSGTSNLATGNEEKKNLFSPPPLFIFFKKIPHILLTVLVKERLVKLFTVLCVSVSERERENQAKKETNQT